MNRDNHNHNHRSRGPQTKSSFILLFSRTIVVSPSFIPRLTPARGDRLDLGGRASGLKSRDQRRHAFVLVGWWVRILEGYR